MQSQLSRKVSAKLCQLTVSLLAMVLVSCAPTDSQEPTARLKLYTSVPLAFVEVLKKEFEQRNPDIELVVNRAGTVRLLEQLQQQEEKNSVEADVVWLADFSASEALKARHILRAYNSPEAASIPAYFKDQDNAYTGSRILNMVLVYNTAHVDTAPRDYWQLSNEKWRGKVGIVNPNTSGSSFYTIATLLLNKHFDWEFFARLFMNDCVIVRNNRELMAKINSGEIHLGIGIDYSVRKYRASTGSQKIDYALPRHGVVSVVSPIAITRSTSREKQAEKFVDWVLSAQGQSLLGQMGITPARRDAQAAPGVLRMGQLHVMPSNAVDIHKQRQNLLAMFNNIFSGTPIEDLRLPANWRDGGE